MATCPNRCIINHDLGYHVFILSTQSPDVDRPLLYATVFVLFFSNSALNIVAIFAFRANMRRKMRMLH
jgi:ABC-type phosphate transport system permease subunit